MRVSFDPDDQGFHPGRAQFAVTLDGKLMPHAVTADEELGLVHVLTAGPETAVLRGRVKIESLH